MEEESKKKNASLPKLRLSSELYDKIKKALARLNQNELGAEFSLAVFRRMALKSFSEKILSEGLALDVHYKDTD